MHYKNIFLFLFLAIVFVSCEEEFLPEISSEPPEIVVEGYIEAGENANPPYVLLTWSSPFFNEINLDEFDELFVHDAIITVSDGTTEVQLVEFCLNDLSEEQQGTAAELFGLDADSLAVNFCVYLDPTFSMQGEIGKTYNLNIQAADKTLTASTRIPNHVPIDSLFLVDAPGVPNDTLRQMRGFMDDPGTERNYYRYYTGINGEDPFPSINSVFDDAFFDGVYFEFILAKSERPTEEIDFNDFGLFVVGDTASIKWTNMDKIHYDFWATLEFNNANQGPFSSYTRIATNIDGGLGIWGGSSVSYYEVVIE